MIGVAMDNPPKPEPKFSCHCSRECGLRVTWFSQAPLALSFQDGEPCACTCHEFAAENQAARERAHEAGYRYHFGWLHHPKTIPPHNPYRP